MKIFVTGTDTGVGKTVVTGLLANYLLKNGYRVITQKWIQTGSGRELSVRGISDIDIHLKFMGLKRIDFKEYFSFMSPYIFKFPASPHLAANLEKKKISKEKIIKSVSILSKKFDFVIAEGIGGILVPINENYLLVDLVKELNLPVLIVASNKLGTINHTLLTIEAIKKRNIKIIGIVFNNVYNNESRVILNDNTEIIKKLSSERILGVLPWQKNVYQLKKKFRHIGDMILKRGWVL